MAVHSSGAGTSTAVTAFLPEDWRDATLVGRLDRGDGPLPVVVRHGIVRDVAHIAPTVSKLLAGWSGSVPGGVELGAIDELPITPAHAGAPRLRLLSPFDLQCVKACGVTFAVSALERVIEERARGDSASAAVLRSSLQARIGADLRAVKPGSEMAARLKTALVADGMWSQYLEVAIGPDAEIFTKAQPLSSVGWGDLVGVRDDSTWNNPEPEVVLACNRDGRILGAALGNDVNLRDFEGRSALLLGKAKDNNAACAIGPFIRLFDDRFGMDDVRQAVLRLEVTGADGFHLDGESSMGLISRDPAELVAQTLGRHHQYPDGLALFLGTLFAPIVDRDTPGQGFTHRLGDLVRVSSPRLGVLENRVTSCAQAPPWTLGIGALMDNLARRGLLQAQRVRP